MLSRYTVKIFMAFLGASAAQECWRDTICTPRTASFSGAWDSYMLSPASRTISPVKILNIDKTVLSSYPGAGSLASNGSLLIYDFGQEVGGIITLKYEAEGVGSLGLAFSEAWNWTGYASDGSDGTYHPGGDGALYTTFSDTTSGTYTVPDVSLRGGFRYLSIFAITDETISVNITSIALEVAFQPTWPDLRAYGGYFYSNDELINRIWYAGAYTLQTNAVPPNTGREYPLLDSGWKNDAFLGTPGSTIFVDGSKRDRATWSGDLAVALPSAFVSTGDFESAKNALQLQYDLQLSTGELPMVGPPINFYGSDTYHLSSVLGTYEYVLHSGDLDFLTYNWNKMTLAMTFITDKIDNTGLLSVTGTADWGRYAQGGHNTEANALMYGSLIQAAIMANWTGNAELAAMWNTQASTLKSAINTEALNWDSSVGAFKDSDTDASVHPEDGNSLALFYDMADPSHFASISTQLTNNWGDIGAVCPELKGNIVPYIESMEVKGHLAVRQVSRALDLMRLSWGWYLNNPYGTGSSTPEGYLADGTFGYRATSGYGGDYSYTSHAHGWSTGPTHALSIYVLGLRFTAPGGASWVLSPQFGDLTSVDGGYTSPIGKFSAFWKLKDGGYKLGYNVPSGTAGSLVLPAGADTAPMVLVDGVVVKGVYDPSMGLFTIENQPGGVHNIIVTY